jgi:excisionase family DNA binding protein
MTLLTISEVADRLRVSERTIRRRISDGEIPAYQLGGNWKTVRIDEAELLKWLHSSPSEVEARLNGSGVA